VTLGQGEAICQNLQTGALSSKREQEIAGEPKIQQQPNRKIEKFRLASRDGAVKGTSPGLGDAAAAEKTKERRRDRGGTSSKLVGKKRKAPCGELLKKKICGDLQEMN